MAANALVQTRIDAEVKERAAEILGEMGMTVSDAVRILLTRTAKEGALPFAPTPKDAASEAAYDAWFREKVQGALDDARPTIPNEEVEAQFAHRRADARRRAAK